MGLIKRLESHIADKIAAGEVIERPLSVVKELLENSLDAGADTIEIEIREGGVSLIRVKDNGRGMDGDDLRLAFERHATSKISEFQDLFRLNTFGFRGEALPSIATVAQVEMTSCTANENVGHKIRIDGGVVKAFEETASTPGTVIDVQNLFYNIPARRKFLKSSSYEAGLIGDLVSKYAMGHPNVRFRYVSNGQLQLDTAGLSTVEQRMAYIYGNNLKSLIVAVPEYELSPGRLVKAWLVREDITRNNRGQEVFFVNGRLIKSAALSQTLEESYYTLIPKGRFPIAIVDLTIPGSELDVNIHPAKTEIKINGFEQLKPKLIDVLKDALWEANITKNAFLPETVAPDAHRQMAEVKTAQSTYSANTRPKTEQKTTQSAPKTIIQEHKNTNTGKNSFKPVQAGEEGTAKPYPTMKEQIRNNLADVVAQPEKLYQIKPQQITPAEVEKLKTVSQDILFENADKKAVYTENVTKIDSDLMPKVSINTDTVKNKRESVIEQKDEKNSSDFIKQLSVIGQLNNAFILAQNEEGLYIIDQHTCHERILYEKFMREEAEKAQLSQPLLIPVTITLSAQQDAVLMEHIFTLRDFGFIIEHFGDRSYLLRSLPLGLHDLPDADRFFIDLLHDLESQKTVTSAMIKEKLLITASCKGAVKANWPLTEIEMKTLLYDLAQVENAHTCPHGRPIIYKITMQELYKIFKRGTYHE
ncbi:MAG: DNA mismatch repair endonuclease MutL [Peptococcaceae bacterium]|nr:DNA mismatch repair endonuclease MutL [Peptococcaceae bacterium]